MPEYHTPVLLRESVEALVGNPSGTYVDATFGGGGHTAGILSRLNEDGRVIAFDRDIDAIQNQPDDGRVTLIRNNFRFILNYIRLEGVEEGLDGILADLGVSSHQFDSAQRGFSFRFDAPLDMRMNSEIEMTAADIVNSATAEELERIFHLYGEVSNAREISRLIVSARGASPILRTSDLDRVLEPALPNAAPHKALARIYQALRIEVNQEMRSLEKFLLNSAACLRTGGILAVITYHSLEDRMVKNYMRYGNVEGVAQKDAYGVASAPMEVVTRKPIVPSEEEIASNTRARSAKLRVARKI